MKRARIGTTDIDTSLTIWTDGQQWMRLNACEQYADISALNAEYNLIVDKDADKAEQLLNRMDVAYTTIKIIEAYGGQAELLKRAGIVLGQMIEAGEYAKSYASMDERNTALNSKIAALQHEVENWQNWQFTSETWQKHWQDDIMDNDYYANPATGERLTDQPGNFAAVGAQSSQDRYMDQIAEAGSHWLYACVDSEEALDQFNKGIPYKVKTKLYKQIKQAEWFKSANTGLTPNSVYRSARAGLIDYHKQTPEESCRILQVASGDVYALQAKVDAEEAERKLSVGEPITLAFLITSEGIKWLIGIIIGALTAISIIVGIVLDIVAFVENQNALKNAPTEAELAAAQAEQTDYLNYMKQLDDPLENLGAEIIDFVRKPIVWIVAGGVLLLRSTKK